MSIPAALAAPELITFLAASLVVAGIYASLKIAAEKIKDWAESEQCDTCKRGTVPPPGAITFHDEHLLNRKRFGGAETVTKEDYAVMKRLV